MTQVFREPDAPTLEAIYNVQKHVKQYVKKVNENYRRRSRREKITAQQHSIWKDATYTVETRARKGLLRENKPETVEKHRITRDDP